MKKTIIGILAHVDAGKTTLSESMLYHCGSIRTLGRVDHKDAFLDYNAQERNRGITIFSKQAFFQWKDCEITIIDTPGHMDFSAEMERTLQVLDYAVLLISGLDGIQAHTETIWKLLKHYQIPTFLFVNKMDISFIEKASLLKKLEKKLDFRCVDFTLDEAERKEKISLCDENLLEYYLKHMDISEKLIQQAIFKRQVFPCYFGSALKMVNVDSLLDGLALYTMNRSYSETFGALVYKISHDEQGNQLTHMKITGGSLKVKARLLENEKVDQIRIYSGAKYRTLDEVFAGSVCAVKGLHNVFVGEGLGMESNALMPQLTSYLQYHVLIKERMDIHAIYKNMQLLAKEDPQLHVHFHESNQQISVQLMGEIQTEVLKAMMHERFHMDIDFTKGSVIYRETIMEAIEGVGHYEPLRHYAEVHLLLKPLAQGSGIKIVNECDDDVLSRNWQRLILSHIEEKEHLGVLTGSPITDIEITLLAGKAHLKHTEGGDFRQATYRAIRQGLKSTKSILLEPYYHFQLTLPQECVSKAIYDIESVHGSFQLLPTSKEIEEVIISGRAPVNKMQNYQREVIAYTKGRGRLICTMAEYAPCVEEAKIIEEINYDSEHDLENPTGSVFCTHGAGYYVKWNEVKNHMHLKPCWQKQSQEVDNRLAHNPVKISEEELAKVMIRTYGSNTSKLHNHHSQNQNTVEKITYVERLPKCLLVDGYNMIYSWENLKEIALDNLDAAREKLIHMMSSYQGYKKCLLILVFDANKVANGTGSKTYNGSIHIVYTKKAQTADSYIESTTHKLAKQYQISVATSDGMEQLIVSAQGARRISSRELEREILYLEKNSILEYESKHRKGYVKPLAAIKKINEEE